MPVTSYPRRVNRRAKCAPINPAAPVTRIRLRGFLSVFILELPWGLTASSNRGSGPRCCGAIPEVVRKASLVGALSGDDDFGGTSQDVQIQPWRPVLDVVAVQPHAF